MNSKKTKLMTVNIKKKVTITVRNEPIEEVESFTYLGSNMSKDGGSEEDIQIRLGKARRVFAQLSPVWRSKQYRRETKLRIYQSCVVPVLLYGSECWRMTQRDSSNLASFHNGSLRKICRIYWPDKITNKELYNITKQEDIRTTIKMRRWRWVGHSLRRDEDNIARTALRWTPEGKRRRGRPKTTWRRTLEIEAQAQHKTWSDLEMMAKKRHEWSDFVAALCASPGREEDK